MSEQRQTREEHIPVLIVGGSVVGLSTALFLSWHGIPSLLVERHQDSLPHARAGVFNTRTMEIFRQAGIEAAIFQRETPPQRLGTMGLHVESLVGKVLPSDETAAHQRFQQDDPFASPTRRALIGQDRIEPIIRAHASASGSDIRFGTELIAFTQHNHGVTALIRDRKTGVERHIHAQYLVAADGNRSTIRQQLGITSYGYGMPFSCVTAGAWEAACFSEPAQLSETCSLAAGVAATERRLQLQTTGRLGKWVSIVFRTDLSQVPQARNVTLCFVNNPVVEGILGRAEDHWALLATLPPSSSTEELPETRIHELVHAALGLSDQPIEIVSTLYWELAARVAAEYQRERVHLVGDAAHVMTTMGGFGANTGIADAHNLAWKLAYVLKGYAPAELLSTYCAERQPAADLAVSVSTGLYAYRLPTHARRDEILQSSDALLARVRSDPAAQRPSGFSVAMGYRYRSKAIISEGEEDGVLYENEPSSSPGTRAPHIWLQHHGRQISLLDLYGHNFVLLTGPDGHSWHESTRQATTRLALPLDQYSIGPGEAYTDEGSFLATYNITASGAILVRPDGFIAWRAREADAHAESLIEQVLRQVLCRE